MYAVFIFVKIIASVNARLLSLILNNLKMEKFNAKALSIEGLNELSTKVTLGFKCNPKLKLKLALEAQGMNLTLSEYVESIICNHDIALTANKELKKRLEHYENDFLKSHFQKHKNTTVTFKNSQGENCNQHIYTLQDVYTVIIQIVK